MRRRNEIWWAVGFSFAAFVTVVGCILLWCQTAEVMPGVQRTPLPGGCSLMHYTLASEQPFRTIALIAPALAPSASGPCRRRGRGLKTGTNRPGRWDSHMPVRRLTATNLRALTPLKWQHINPYGTFTLIMQERLPLQHAV